MRYAFILIIAAMLSCAARADEISTNKILRDAKKGGSESQVTVGLWHLNGKAGMNIDCQKAFDWFGKSAAQGNQSATIYLYAMYQTPQCEDSQKYSLYLEKAAEAGEKQSQYMWGLELIQRLRPDLASVWLEKSSNQGNWYAMSELGLLYRDGKGIPQNFIYSYKWLNCAAASGMVTSAAALRDEVAKRMDVISISEAQKLSLACAEKK